MKNLYLSAILILGALMLSTSCARDSESQSPEAMLKNVDAMQAMALANEWKWSKRDIKSYVTSREVVFKFPDGKTKRIPLPKEQMLVAVAPYVNQTHR